MSADPSRSGLPVGARFALVGVVNTAIDLVLFVLLSSAGAPLLVANFVSTSAGMSFSYVTNRAWSFGSTQSVRRSLVPFLVVTAAGLWLIQPLVITIVVRMLESAGESSDWDLWAAKAAAIGVGLVWNFVWYRHVVFAPEAAEQVSEKTSG